MPRPKKIKNMTFGEIVEACHKNIGCVGCPFKEFKDCPIGIIHVYAEDILEETMPDPDNKLNGSEVTDIWIDEFDV